jgi:hypothetical protein
LASKQRDYTPETFRLSNFLEVNHYKNVLAVMSAATFEGQDTCETNSPSSNFSRHPCALPPLVASFSFASGPSSTLPATAPPHLAKAGVIN